MTGASGLLARSDQGQIDAVLAHASRSVAAAVPEGLQEQTAWVYSDGVTALYSPENLSTYCQQLRSTDPVAELATHSVSALMLPILSKSPIPLSVARYAAQMLLLEWLNSRSEMRCDAKVHSLLIPASEALDLEIIAQFGITPPQVVHYCEPPSQHGTVWH